MEAKPRLLRITTVPVSLKLLLRGQFTFFQNQGFEVLTVSADGPEVADLKSEGTAHCIVPMTRTITPLKDLICLWQLVRIILRFKPDIVHTHTPKAGLLGMIAAWVCRVPVRMHTVAGLPLMELTGVKRWIVKQTERVTYYCAHYVYPNSKGLMDFILKEIKMDTTKLKMVGKGSSNGIDVNFFSKTAELEKQSREIRLQYKINDGEIVFCFVGRLVTDKGITEMVNAFEAISQQLPSRLLLVGPFEEDRDPLPEKTRLSIRQNNHRIIVTGFQKDVRPFILASDVFVFPSYREGFPNVIMQAACLGIPSIVSDINGCNELIVNEKTGLIIPSKNEKQLQAAMLRMAADAEERKQMAQHARIFVSGFFDQKQFWKELDQEYKSLLTKSEQRV